MAQNDTHVALIIYSNVGGGELLVEKTFSDQILCSCAFGANIRSYTKQRARHGTPFLQPPPPSHLAGVHIAPPPHRAIFRLPNGRRLTDRMHPEILISIECMLEQPL